MTDTGALRFKRTRQGVPLHPYTMAGGAVLSAVVGLAAATQYVADRLGYHPNLGAAFQPRESYSPAWGVLVCLLALLSAVLVASRARAALHAVPMVLLVAAAGFAAARGPLYPPVRVVQWGVAFHRTTTSDPHAWSELKPIFEASARIGLLGFGAGFGAFVSLLLGASVKRASNSHGTAEFGTGDDLVLPGAEERWRRERRRAGRKVIEPGVMIGRLPPRRVGFITRPGPLLWYRGPSHVLTMAPTRSGKGVGAVIPTLLRYPGSVVCTDVKGENFHVTHKQREAAGGTIYVLDPFRVTGEHPYHAFANPLDTIDTQGLGADRALDDCKALAEMLVEEEGKENRHFSDEGRSLLASFMLHVCHEFHSRREERTLLKVRELLTLPGPAFEELLVAMAASDNALVRRGVARLEQKEERERTGVISTAQRGIDFLDSLPMARVLVPPLGSAAEPGGQERPAPNQVALTRLKGDDPLTVYLVIPPESLKTHAAWLRMMIACVNNMITRLPGRPAHRVLMLLDEFAQLGHIRPVLEGISLVGGYGVLYWLVVQDLAQLKGRYKETWETIFSNCDVKQCFGTADWTTADLLSKMTGETTLFTEGGSSGTGRSHGKSSGHSINYGESVSERGRRLLLPDEVMRLPATKQLLFIKGSAPLCVDKVNYLSDPEFRGRKGLRFFATNPMYS